MVVATETLDELSEMRSDSRSAEIYDRFAGVSVVTVTHSRPMRSGES